MQANGNKDKRQKSQDKSKKSKCKGIRQQAARTRHKASGETALLAQAYHNLQRNVMIINYADY